MPEFEPMLSRARVAELLGVSLKTVDRLAGRGELPHVKIRRRTLFDPLDVRAYLLRHRAGSAAGAEPTRGHVSPGQLRALHGKAGDLDRRDGEARGTWKRAILHRASQRFGREITSAGDLSDDEAGWVLDELERELQRR